MNTNKTTAIMVKAIIQDEYGLPDVLQLRYIDRPEIEDDEVLLRAHAAGMDRGYGTS